MRVAVVGAGVAGLASAKVLHQLGMDVTVLDRAPDVGGVWSRTRRYPGVRTQNDKGTYAFSELSMPEHYPEFPSGAQVQAYLEDYVAGVPGLDSTLHLGTEVLGASLINGESSWRLRLRGSDGTESEEDADHLVVANGIFSQPFVPALDGREAFERAGGRVLATSEVADLEMVRGRHVLVVGYGRSACDLAVAVSGVAASTTVVARHLMWKMPARIAGVVGYQNLMLTRLGEALFRYRELRGAERFLHGPGDSVRRRVLAALQAVVARQGRLAESGLVPAGSFEDIARSTVSLVSDGFFEAVRAGRITVRRDAEVARLDGDGRDLAAELADGARVAADVVVCGTGFRQEVPFLDDDVLARLRDAGGSFRLHRHVQPLDVPHLSFAGYNSSLFSPLSAEVAAVWIGALLTGGVALPPREEALAEVDARLAWMEERTSGRHAHGTNVIPFSMHTIDELLADVDRDVSRPRRALQWLLPVDPAAYAPVVRDVVAASRASG